MKSVYCTDLSLNSSDPTFFWKLKNSQKIKTDSIFIFYYHTLFYTATMSIQLNAFIRLQIDLLASMTEEFRFVRIQRRQKDDDEN